MIYTYVKGINVKHWLRSKKVGPTASSY